MAMQAVGLKSHKIYVEGVDKPEVSRLLIRKFSKLRDGAIYPEPIVYQKSDSAAKQ